MPAPPRSTAPQPIEIPNPFGRYKILRKLGQGGMGTVYLAHDTRLQRPVALKVLHDFDGETSEHVARFYREARVLAGLSHPNLCRVHDVGEVAGRHYLTMEYYPGRTLDVVRGSNKPMKPEHAVKVVRRLAQAMHKAHERGVVHRDLKPSNILVTDRNDLVIIDFGLARRVDAGDVMVTQAGQVLGTPAYMSPELVSGDLAAIGPACDVYSLGVMLYEMLTGRRPFSGPVTMICMQILGDPPEPPSKHRKDLDPLLEAVCLKALEKAPGDRHASMAEFVSALDEWSERRTSAETEGPAADLFTARYLHAALTLEAPPPEPPPGGTEPAADAAPSREASPAPPALPLPTKRYSKAGVAAAIVLVSALALGLYVLTDTGTVKVVLGDPSATAAIDGRPLSARELEDTVTLRRGPHVLTVERPGRPPQTWPFTLARGEVEVLIVGSPRPGAGGGGENHGVR
ncbi:MAG: serine/threonine-protein kinase [Isosphaeraceae bacterium]